MFLKPPPETESEKRSKRMMGNKYYLLRSKDGRDKIFETPGELWEKCCEYFQYVEENPLQEERAFSTKNGVIKADLRKCRAMTLAGLCVFLGVVDSTFRNYRKLPEFEWVVKTVDNIIYSQKFEGAAAGMLNANIIARDLGLADKQELSGGLAVTKKNFNDFYNDDES